MMRPNASYQFEVVDRWRGGYWGRQVSPYNANALDKVFVGSPGKHRLLSSSKMEEAASVSSEVQGHLRIQDQAHKHKCPHPMSQGASLILPACWLCRRWWRLCIQFPLQPCHLTIRFGPAVSTDGLPLHYSGTLALTACLDVNSWHEPMSLSVWGFLKQLTIANQHLHLYCFH